MTPLVWWNTAGPGTTASSRLLPSSSDPVREGDGVLAAAQAVEVLGQGVGVELDPRGVAQDGGGEGAAEVHLQARHAAGSRGGQAGAGHAAAAQDAGRADAVQGGGLGEGGRQQQQGDGEAEHECPGGDCWCRGYEGQAALANDRVATVTLGKARTPSSILKADGKDKDCPDSLSRFGRGPG